MTDRNPQPEQVEVGIADLSARTRLEITGGDRASFLHNMCTNEIRKLAVGSGCEAFLLNAKGHVLAYVSVFARADSLWLETVPGQASAITEHLDRYIIREDVQLYDRTNEMAEFLLAGPQAKELLAGATAGPIPTARLAGSDVEIAGCHVHLRRVDFFGPEGFLIFCPLDEQPAAVKTFARGGARPCGEAAVEAARIEAGFPYFGVDISDHNLPQEVGRDAQAISFVKGCYIGQETVARLDALGHVNKRLAGIRFLGREVPPAGTVLSAAGQAVGEVTSAAFSPRLQAPLALGYVRRGHYDPGTKLDSACGAAEVVSLPVW